MIIHRLFTLLLTVVFACNISKICAQDEVIEHQGNKYIIHVEQLNPDSEMTLLFHRWQGYHYRLSPVS